MTDSLKKTKKEINAEIKAEIFKEAEDAYKNEDYSLAVQKYIEGAHIGDAFALKRYGECLVEGIGVEKNEEKGQKYIKRGEDKLWKDTLRELAKFKKSEELKKEQEKEDINDNSGYYSSERIQYSDSDVIENNRPGSSQAYYSEYSQYSSQQPSAQLSARKKSQQSSAQPSARKNSQQPSAEQTRENSPVQSLRNPPVQSEESTPAQSQENPPVQSQKNSPAQSRENSPVQSLRNPPEKLELKNEKCTMRFNRDVDVENYVIYYANNYLSTLNDYYNVILSDNEIDKRNEYRNKINKAWNDVQEIIDSLDNNDKVFDTNSKKILNTLEEYNKNHGDAKIVWDTKGIIKRELYDKIKDTFKAENDKEKKLLEKDFLDNLQIPKKELVNVYLGEQAVGTVNYSRTAKYLAEKKNANSRQQERK
ncbi:MAG: hypothetical protein Ta2D_08580 [Rickettsiales bacterium]|nr:MAG: hypothetical protein Ta2D_08580 [Rickettsiales bacterium]